MKFNKYLGKTLFCFLTVFSLSVACNDITDETPLGIVLVSDFSEGPQGWSPFFTNIPSNSVEEYQLQINITPLPESTGQSRNGLYVSGSNKGSEIHFFLKKEVTGLTPNKLFRLIFRMDVATNIAATPSNFVSKSASNESGLNMLAGALSFEPNITGNSPLTGLLEPNFNNQIPITVGDSNSDIINLGPLQHQDEGSDFQVVQLENINYPFLARSNNAGTIWLLIGFHTDKPEDFEVYFRSARVLFTEL